MTPPACFHSFELLLLVCEELCCDNHIEVSPPESEVSVVFGLNEPPHPDLHKHLDAVVFEGNDFVHRSQMLQDLQISILISVWGRAG